MKIHIHQAGQQSGPFTLDEVREKLRYGGLSPSDMAWYEGLTAWIPVSQLPGLAITPPTLPPLRPTPPGPPPRMTAPFPVPHAATPPRRGPIIAGAVATLLLSAMAFLGGLGILASLNQGDSPLLGILLLPLGIAGFIVSVQFFNALSINPTGCCQVCGHSKPTVKGSLNRHFGAVILMFHRSLRGHMCKDCLSKVFWEFTPLTAVLGWWGLFSFFITPVVLVNNVAFFVRSRFLK